MARIDLARRAEIGRERRARTRAQIVEAAAMLLSERPPEALTVDAVVEAAGVAKGTFYYHFQSMEELAAAVGEKLGESFDELLMPARLGLQDPIARISFAFTQFLAKAIADPLWARLVVQSAQAPTEFARSVREQSQVGSDRGEGSGALDHAGRRAGRRHRLGHLASGHARHSSTAGRAGPGRPNSRRHASSAWRVLTTAATEGRRSSVVNDPIQKSSSSREREIGRSNRRDGLRPCVPPAMVLFVSRCFAMDLRLHHAPRRHVHRLEHDCDVDMGAIRRNFSR